MRRPYLAAIVLVGACGAAERAAPPAKAAPTELEPLDPPPPPEPPPAADPAPAGSHLLVLGTAQDGGFPHAACDCVRCRAAREDEHLARHISSVALVLPELGETYLFDATPDIRPQLQMIAGEPTGKVDRRPVDGVFLTHAHIGHYLGLAFLGFEAVHTRDLPVYATPAMTEFLADNAPWSQLVKIGNIAPMPTEPGHPVTLGDVTVTSVKVPHRDEFADTVAYVFQGPERRAVFIPDCDPWARWEQSVDELFEGADVLLVDATFYSPDELPGRSIEDIGHPLMTDSMDRWEEDVKAGRRSVHFIHLNHSNPALDPKSREAMTVKNRGFEVLRAGRRLEL